MRKNQPASAGLLALLVMLASGIGGCSPDSDAAPPDSLRAPFDEAAERAAVEQAVRAMIGWAQTKDFELLHSTPVQDSTYLEVDPGNTVVKGYDAFVAAVEWFRSPDFRAVRYEIRDLRITFSRSGDVAWYYCVLDDVNEWRGQPASWMNTRWTGVLEKLDGRWRVMQMHFSFAQEG